MDSSRHLVKRALVGLKNPALLVSTRVLSSTRPRIEIPARIERSPTDILKALSETVGRDPVAPPFGYIDDALHIPYTNTDLKNYVLSRESGRKAARMMIEKFPEVFFKDKCEPHVPAFYPDKVFTEEELKYPSEDLIYSLVDWGKFNQAFETYSKCKDQKIPVSESCKMVLLDYFSIYNGDDFQPMESLSEKWFHKSIQEDRGDLRNSYLQKSSWKKKGPAEIVFADLKAKPASAYCSLIKGMAKHLEVDEANKVFEEMLKANLTPDLNTMNALVRLIENMSDKDKEQKIKLLNDKLMQMAKFKIMPNVRTFNNALAVVKSLGIFQSSISTALSLFKEMTTLGIEPSLATYAHLLSIFYPARDVGGNTRILGQVIDRVEKMPKIEWQDPEDSIFFRVAMEKCHHFGESIEIVDRVYNLLNRDDNKKFLSDQVASSKFYENYLFAILKLGTPQQVTEKWGLYTPFVFIPTQRLIQKMVFYIYDLKLYDFIPDFWANLMSIKYKNVLQLTSQVMEILLLTMVSYNGKDANLIESYGKIAENMIRQYPYVVEPEQRFEERMGLFKLIEYKWTDKMVSNLIVLCTKTNRLDLAWTEFKRYKANVQKIPGELKFECIECLLGNLIKNERMDESMELLDYASEIDLPTILRFVDDLENFEYLLSDDQKSKIEKIKQRYSSGE